jgi:hypothetical protein
MKRIVTGGVLMYSLALIGCGEEPDGVEQSVQAYTESSCMLANYDHHDVGGIDPAWVSPRTYDNPKCHKAVIVDMASYSDLYWGNGDIDGQTLVEWNDTEPTTESACKKLWLGATLYLWSQGNQSYSERIRREAYGRWEGGIAGGSPFCRGPSLAFHSTTSPDLIVGRKYRLGITARTENSSAAPTRSVRVESRRPVWIK